jgi:eukaryotic-like serine/threonine-protein kinase
VKVLDFGLAKVLAGEADATDPADSQTPTAVGTRADVILGTAAYMSPEQARGGRVDQRTDIWAFGCVVYEMLTGRRAFDAPTVSDTIVAVLDREPDWRALPKDMPAHVHRLLRRCLEKESRRRLRDIGDARLELEDAHVIELRPPDPAVSQRESRAAWWVAGFAVLVAAMALGWVLRPALLPEVPRRSTGRSG